MAEYLDKSYRFVLKNFIRIGILLLLLGIFFFVIGIFISGNSSNYYSGIAFTLTGGFLFLSGTIFIVSSVKHS